MCVDGGHLADLGYDSDYLYALNACYNTGASYVIMLEDDVIVADGWMAKTRQALQHIESNSHVKEEFWNWIYLRLFYTETSMQWEDTDFWYYHMWLTFSLASWSGFILLIFTRHLFPSKRRYLDNWSIAAICLITIPAFTALLFMIGKYSLFPPHGVFKMNKHGCCTQAMLFPRTEIPELVAYLEGRGHGQTDAMIEDYSDKTGKQRLALAPQQVQHVGLQSSRDNTFVNSQSTWAFWFETNDWKKLRKEHKQLTKKI
jgi:GR25 family glycosyltransferase involved in LPS biosynthesis